MERLIVTPEEAGKMLRIRPATIRELCDMGEIAHYKVGRYYKIPVEALKKYVHDRAYS